MGKIVGIAELKAHCTRLLREMARDGQSITVTNRGQPVAELKPVARKEKAKALFGALKGSVTFAADFDPAESALDSDWEEIWEANNPAELYSKQ
jgi:prevent-host-death family protein